MCRLCYVGTDGEKFYQYTMIEEASRERFIYAYKENSSYSTVDFVQRAIVYFGYAPDIIQTDNGGEFTHTRKTQRIHPLDALCNRLHITHKTIRPATPWHNGKVERSHRMQIMTNEIQQQLEDYLFRNRHDYHAGILIAMFTGMRLGEVCALQWKDYDADKGRLHVNKTVRRETNYDAKPGENRTMLVVNANHFFMF